MSGRAPRDRRAVRAAILLAVVLAVALLLLLVAARPVLGLAVAAGLVAGVLWARRTGEAPRAREIGALVAVLVVVGTIVAIGSVLFAGRGGLPFDPRDPVRGVRAVDYSGEFELDASEKEWRGRESVVVDGRVFTELAKTRQARRRLARPELLLGPDWRFDGDRDGGKLAYARDREEPVAIDGPPSILTDNELPLPRISPPGFRIDLVPGKGSVLELETPLRAVYDEDPAAERRRTDDADSLEIVLERDADSPGRRLVEMKVANRLGRWSVYEGARDFTTWGILKTVLWPLVFGAIAYLAQRLIKRRWPEGVPARAPKPGTPS